MKFLRFVPLLLVLTLYNSNAFAEEITRLASKNKKIVLLSGDIGNRLFDKFRNKFPNRFYNCGIAEACMTGVASGISSVGLRPVTYTIATFNTIRCLEQIKLDICYTNMPVIIVGRVFAERRGAFIPKI